MLIRTTKALAAVLVLAQAAPALSADRLQLTLGQGFTLENRFGDTGEDRNALRSTTDLGIAWRGATARTNYGLNLGFRLLGRTDSGDDSAFEVPLPTIGGRIERRGLRLRSFASLSVVPEFTSDRDFDVFNVLDETTGDVVDVQRRARDEDVLQINVNAQAGTSLQIDPRNSLSLNASVRVREYENTSDTLQPTRNYGATLGWNRQFDSRTSGGLTAGIRQFESDREDQPGQLTTSLSGSLSRRFTPRHSGDFSVGVSIADSDVDFTGGANLSYRANNALSFRLGADQSVVQSDEGELRTVSRLRANSTYRVNSLSSVGLGSVLSFDTPFGSDTGNEDVTLVLSAQYQLRLTRDWNMTVSYGFQVESDRDSIGDDVTGSNRVLFRISRALDFLQ